MLYLHFAQLNLTCFMILQLYTSSVLVLLLEVYSWPDFKIIFLEVFSGVLMIVKTRPKACRKIMLKKERAITLRNDRDIVKFNVFQ